MRRIGSMTWHRHMFRGSRTLRGGRKYGRRSCMAWSARGVPPGWAIMARGHRGRDGPFPLLPRYPVHGRRGLCLGQDDAHGGFSAIRQCLAARLAERVGRSEYVIIGRSPGGASLRARISPCRRASAGGCSIRPRRPAAASLPACFAPCGHRPWRNVLPIIRFLRMFTGDCGQLPAPHLRMATPGSVNWCQHCWLVCWPHTRACDARRDWCSGDGHHRRAAFPAGIGVCAGR